MKICKNCGAQNKDTSLFCEGCGTKLNALQESVVNEQPVQQAPEQNAYTEQPVQHAPEQNVYTDQSAQQAPQQNTYQQPVNSTATQDTKKKTGNWMTITSLILSILSVLCCCLDVLALIMAIASIVLAIIALATHKGNKGMAIASLIVGIIGFLFAVYLLVYAYILLPNNPDLQYQLTNLYDELGVTGFIWK